jgi:hypothetical protein
LKIVRIDVTSEQLGKLRQDVFCNQRLSEVQRRREVKKVLPLPLNGSRVDLYCEGEYSGTV